jgi:hypothetical protein
MAPIGSRRRSLKLTTACVGENPCYSWGMRLRAVLAVAMLVVWYLLALAVAAWSVKFGVFLYTRSSRDGHTLAMGCRSPSPR